MKKTRIQKLHLNRETLGRLMNRDLAGIHGGGTETQNGCSVPSCIDGCPSALCTSIAPGGTG